MKNKIIKGLLVAVISLSVSCGSSKSCNNKLASKDCPSEGKCTVVVHKDKALLIKMDEFGKPHYEMEANPSKNVVVYTYNKDVPKDVMDANYREEVVLELDKKQQSSSLTGKSKGNIKALFGRFCYCKGSTGYYFINEGSLMLSDPEHQNYTVDFKITEVPQVVNTIQFSLK